MLLHIIQTSNQKKPSSGKRECDISVVQATSADLESHIVESYKMVSALYGPFKSKAKEQVSKDLPIFSG